MTDDAWPLEADFTVPTNKLFPRLKDLTDALGKSNLEYRIIYIEGNIAKVHVYVGDNE